MGKTGQSRSIEKIFITVDGMPLLVYSNTKEVRKIKKEGQGPAPGTVLFSVLEHAGWEAMKMKLKTKLNSLRL